MTLHQLPATSYNHVKVLQMLFAHYVEMLLIHETEAVNNKCETVPKTGLCNLTPRIKILMKLI